jgi:CRP-like cAMP-binding protein
MAGNKTRNLLLAALPEQELESLWKHLEFATLRRRHPVEMPNKKAEYIYFMESGITSIVASPRPGLEIEVSMIGREGVTGLATLLGTDRLPYSSYIQLDATAHQIRSDTLRELIAENERTRSIFLAFAQTVLIQTAETAVANAKATIPERLARWLLMVRDRADLDAIPITHEFLAVMMGCRRPGVTVALQALEEKGLVVCGRSVITITNRHGLEQVAGSYYGLPEKEMHRLLSSALVTRKEQLSAA